LELTDQELLDLALEGDGGAFATLVGRYEIPLRGYFRRRRVEDADAGDLLQETFTRVYRYAASYDPAKRLGSWIFTIASNLFKDRFSKLARRSEFEATVDPASLEGEQAGSLGAPEATALQREAQGEIVDSLRELSDQHRAVFMLKHYYGLKYEEIGKILGCSVGTVKSRMHYACQKLQGSLSSKGLRPSVAGDGAGGHA
jgi:RNA polymerase sigma-70 factor (ECF subfamily)